MLIATGFKINSQHSTNRVGSVKNNNKIDLNKYMKNSNYIW